LILFKTNLKGTSNLNIVTDIYDEWYSCIYSKMDTDSLV